MTRTRRTPRTLAFAIAASFALPTLALTAGCGNNNATPTTTTAPMNSPTPMAQPRNTGLSGKQKVVLLAGAALLYYIYRKDKANNARATAGPNGKPQLYREEKGPNMGAIYYRDPQTHKPIWVTAPAGQQVAVPASEVQQYAPDYQQYMGQAASIPAGASSVPYSQYDPSLGNGAMGGGGRMMAPAGPRGPSGPRGPGM